MYGLNEVRLVGTIVSEINVKTTTTGQKVCNLRLKITKPGRNKDGDRNNIVNYFNIICWEKIAEFVGESLQKYDNVFIQGELSSFTPKTQNNEERVSSVTEIKALKIYPLMEIYNDNKETPTNE